VDKLSVQFREWSQTEIPNQTQIPLCDATTDDDAKLWIDQDYGAAWDQKGGGEGAAAAGVLYSK
jgi:hypothetical protein